MSNTVLARSITQLKLKTQSNSHKIQASRYNKHTDKQKPITETINNNNLMLPHKQTISLINQSWKIQIFKPLIAN